MADPTPQGGPTAADLFEDLVRRREAGEPVDLDALCRAHPELAPALRQHEVAHQLLERLLPGPLGDDAPNDAASLGVDLGPASDADADTPSELLERLRHPEQHGARYEVLGEIGRGGMGVVFHVRDTELRRKLAMKVVAARPEAPRQGTPASDSKTLGRFLEEAQITSQLDHPGIVPVHDIGVDDEGRVFFTMNLVRGEDLRAVFGRVRDGRDGWSQVRAVGVILKVCEAMSYAHGKRVIHRDLKPANIMVGRFGEVYVMDWGLARVLGREDPHDLRIRPDAETAASGVHTERHEQREATPESPLLTIDGQVLGTPAYMSPEQAKGQVERLGPHTDVYAVGAMLYHLISGEMPYIPAGARISGQAICWRVVEGPPKPLHEFGRTAPVELVAICEKAMARDIEARYPNMSALARDLGAYLEGGTVAAYAMGTWAETRKWLRRNVTLAGLLVTGVVAVVLGVFLLSWRLEEQRRAEIYRCKLELDRFARDSGNPDFAGHGGSAHTWWMTRARQLVAVLPAARRELARVRPQQFPLDLEAARRSYPRLQELERTQQELRWRRRMLRQSPWPPATDERESIDVALANVASTDDLKRLNERVWEMVRPDHPRVLGKEVLALGLAKRLVEKSEELGLYNAVLRDTLAFALFRTGDFAGALEQQARAARERPERHDLAGNVKLLESLRDAWGDVERQQHQCDRLADEIAAMESEIDVVAESVWHAEVAALVVRLARLEHRLALAERATVPVSAARRWEDAIAAIRASPRYPREFALTRQLDLLPLAPDEVSGLWEFAHLPSGEPARRDGNQLVIEWDTGIVFVLLPGGRVPVQTGTDATPVHDVDLAPFFLSKYEMTEPQWARLGGERRSHTVEHPEKLRSLALADWHRCTTVLADAGGWLCLPTGAQWEYGNRARTTTRWWTGPNEEQLRVGARLHFDQLLDFTGPGKLRANAFGLHDTLGNVAEWCRDRPDKWTSPRPGDGLRDQPGAPTRWLLGGSVETWPNDAHSGPPALPDRADEPPKLRWTPRGGLRPARPVMP